MAHGNRSSSTDSDIEKFHASEIKAEPLPVQDNRPFIPNADIKYIR
jgi:hypothetical protein